MKQPLILAACLPLAIAVSCERSPDGLDGRGPTGSARVNLPVAEEVPGRVEYAYRHYPDPEIARVSYASPMWDGACSANMIGPRFALTAAHCGPAEAAATQTATLRFTVYRSDETDVSSESYTCRRLIHGWPRHDLALLYCDVGADGLGPGDKYGYLDYETRAPAVGDPVYSIWWNPVKAGANPNAMLPLYSAGAVTSITERLWSGVLGPPANEPVAIKIDSWTQGGSSGSGHIDANTHRILVGPLTAGDAQDAPGRYAFSMRTYLDSELLETAEYGNGVGYLQNVTAGNFPAGPYDVNGFVGAVDKDGSNVFDVQEAVELEDGESRRTTYWLDFDNRRRNRLWETGISAVVSFSIDYDANRYTFDTHGPELALWHPHLNLKPNTAYRVGVKVKTTSAGEAAALSIAFERPGQDPWSRARLETQAGTEIVRTALITTDGNPDPHLTLRTTAAFAGSVSEIQLIEDGAMHTFELADDRQGWTTLIASGPSGAAGFLPRGVAAVGPPDFALVVRQALGTVNPVSTDNLIFLTNRRQRFCFMVKAAAATTSVGHLRIVSGGSQVLGQSFPLSTAWQPHCVNQIHTPYTNTTVTFAGSDGAPSYLVDSIGVYADTNGDIGLPGELDPTPQ